MSLPLVSIVTISYNQRDFLEEAICSVFGQSYPNLEYIIYDGGSTDGSLEIIEKYRHKFKYVHIGPDGGPAKALNAAFSKADGEIYAYLNSDDILCAGAVERWVNEFLTDSDISVVFGDIRIIDQMGKPSHLPGRYVSTFLAPPFSERRYAVGASVVPQQASAWKREVFDQVGGFCELNSTCWDYEFFVDAVIKGFKFQRISAVMALFRVHSQSISGTNKWQERRVNDHARIKNKWVNAGIEVAPLEKIILMRSAQLFRVFRYFHLFLSRVMGLICGKKIERNF